MSLPFIKMPCDEFIDALASKASVPGGGGSSALVGAVGMALGSMVGNLTVGKKKYADVEADIIALMEQSALLQTELLRLVDEDAAVFEPLSKAYGIPKDDPCKAQIMENALNLACTVPMDIMRACAKAIELMDGFESKGNTLAISDVGVGVTFCKAALIGASLNVFTNTQLMLDKGYAAVIESEADALLDKYCVMADGICRRLVGRLR